MKAKLILALVGVCTLAVPAGANAHVTLQPSEVAAGDFTVLDVRVPNERDDSATTKVDVQFPPGFIFASYQPLPGWSVNVQMEKLPKPITSHGEKITEQVAQMTWTANGAANAIQAGQFLDFPVSVQIPDEAGETLTFKALQSYDNGEVVRWIGGPESDEPAPQVAVTEGGEGHHAAADDDGAEPDDSGDDGDSDGNGLAIAALIVGGLGLLLGGAALARSRRKA
jgi:periplasmic copper chaperone A